MSHYTRRKNGHAADQLIRTFVKGCGGDWEHARRRLSAAHGDIARAIVALKRTPQRAQVSQPARPDDPAAVRDYRARQRGSEADEGARVPASAPVEEPRPRPGRSSRALLANRIPNWGSPDESVHVGRYLPIWGSLRSIGTSGESRRPAAPRSWASPTSNATPRKRPPNDGPAATGASSRSCTSAFTPTARARRGASP